MSYPYSSLYLQAEWAKMKLASLFGDKEAPAPTDRPVVPLSFRDSASEDCVGANSMIGGLWLFGSCCPLDSARAWIARESLEI
ncbi:MAG TPA: hypothetical protein VE860_10970 [Chthoniobacterales bacterium]|nr:hypothetical protein [Chthoniobacterales bacterium]